MADGDRLSRNGGMNDGTYRIQLTGDETWNGRALHYMRRDELSYMWGTMEERRHQLRRRRFHLCQMVEQIRAEPGATPQLRATQQQYCRELELSIMRYMWDEAQEMIQQALAGAYLVEEHRGRGPPYPQNYRP